MGREAVGKFTSRIIIGQLFVTLRDLFVTLGLVLDIGLVCVLVSRNIIGLYGNVEEDKLEGLTILI